MPGGHVQGEIFHVNFCTLKVLITQQALHHFEEDAGIQHMRSIRMPKHVRRDVHREELAVDRCPGYGFIEQREFVAPHRQNFQQGGHHLQWLTYCGSDNGMKWSGIRHSNLEPAGGPAERPDR